MAINVILFQFYTCCVLPKIYFINIQYSVILFIRHCIGIGRVAVIDIF